MTHSHTYRQKDLLSYKNKNVAIYGFGPTSFHLIVFILKFYIILKLTGLFEKYENEKNTKTATSSVINLRVL